MKYDIAYFKFQIKKKINVISIKTSIHRKKNPFFFQHRYKSIYIDTALAAFIILQYFSFGIFSELNEIRDVLRENKSGEAIFERAISIRSSQTSIKRRRSNNLSNGKVSLSKSATAMPVAAAAAPKEGINLIAKEEAAVGSVGIGIYVRYFKSIGLLYGILTLVCGVAHQGIQVYSNTWLSQWSAHPEANEPHVRDLYLGVYGALGFAQGLKCNSKK